MRLKISKSKNVTLYYVIKTIYINGKEKTITVEKLENENNLKILIEKSTELSKFIVCTAAGLASNANRKFNNTEERAFITTQSIKKLKKPLIEWLLDENVWKLTNNSRNYNIKDILIIQK